MADIFRETGCRVGKPGATLGARRPAAAKNMSGAAAIPSLRDGEAVAARATAAGSSAQWQLPDLMAEVELQAAAEGDGDGLAGARGGLVLPAVDCVESRPIKYVLRL